MAGNHGLSHNTNNIRPLYSVSKFGSIKAAACLAYAVLCVYAQKYGRYVQLQSSLSTRNLFMWVNLFFRLDKIGILINLVLA